MAINTFNPFTLNQYFGTLTIVWVVPLSESKLTPDPRLLISTMLKHFELEEGPTSFPA